LDREYGEKVISEVNTDVVIHHVSCITVDMAEYGDKVEKVRVVNNGSIKNIVEVCKKVGIQNDLSEYRLRI
jgi:dTDP-4-dehydrorhamnose reductase